MSINVTPDPAQSPASMHQGFRADTTAATGTDGTPAARTPDRLRVLTGEAPSEWEHVQGITRTPVHEFDDVA
jgi:hypothetical protein